MKLKPQSLFQLSMLCLLSGFTHAQTDAGTLKDEDVAHNAPDYSPFVDRHLPDKVLWGDTHLHTSYSVDAGFFGTTLNPGMAYRFARGEEVVSSTGQRVKLVRPLDWLVVADHSEYFGLADMLASGDPAVLKDPVTKRWYEMRQGTKEEGMKAFYEVVDSITKSNNLVKNPAIQRTAWLSISLATGESVHAPRFGFTAAASMSERMPIGAAPAVMYPKKRG